MNTVLDITKSVETKSINLISNHKLVIQKYNTGNLVKILGSNGEVQIKIDITEKGPVLRLIGAMLSIQVDGDISIDGGHVAIHGREGINITTDGDFKINADGDLTSCSRIQNIKAEKGNVNIQSNDDIRLDGERIKLNC